MALQAAYTAPSGAVFNESYWRVVDIGINFINQEVSILVHGYINEYTRTAGLEPMNTITLRLGPDKFQQFFSRELLASNSIQAQAYAAVKEFNAVLKTATNV